MTMTYAVGRFFSVPVLVVLVGFPMLIHAESRLGARGWTHDTFGRLVIDGAATTVQSVSIDGTNLVIAFSEPVIVDFGASLDNLSSYLSNRPEVMPDRVLLPLKRPVTIKSFTNGDDHVIDLRPASRQEPTVTANVPDDPTSAGNEGATAEATSVEPSPAPDSSAPAPAATQEPVSTVAQQPPPALSAPPVIRIVRSQDGDEFRIRLDWPGLGSYQLRHSGQFTIIDFSSPGKIDAAELTAAIPEAEIRLETPAAGGVRVILRMEHEFAIQDSREGDAVTLAFRRQLGDRQPTSSGGAQASELAQSNARTDPPSDTFSTLMALPEPDELLDGPPAQFGGTERQPVDVDMKARAAAGGAEIRFDFTAPVRAAAFRVGENLWIVFDHPPRAELRVPTDPALQAVGEIELATTPESLALRIRSQGEAGVSLTGGGNSWVAHIGDPNLMAPIEPIGARREVLADGGSSLFLAAEAPSGPIDIVDERGRLMVIALPTQGLGIDSAVEDDGYLVLPSQQGIVIAPNSARLQIASLPQGVVLTMQGRTKHPADTVADAPQVPDVVVRPLPVAVGIFELPRWRRGGEAAFAADRKFLEDRVHSASDAERAQRRLELAQFLFAHGLADEALGALNIIAMTDPDRLNDPLAHLLQVAAHYFKDDFARAEALVADPRFERVPEALLFRAALAAERRDWPTASDLFAQPLPALKEYPSAFRIRLGLAAANALVEGENPLAAQLFLDQLSRDAISNDIKDRAAFIRGQIQVSIGKPEAGLAIWAGLQDSHVGEVRAKSVYAITLDRLERGEIDAAAAASALDRVRYAWRGNDFELQLLRRLGELYITSDQPRRGLTVWRQAATDYADRPEAKDVAADMQAQFRKLYLEGGADRLSPMMAVALYDEFRELTPTGEDGDRMITSLADRLVKVDLLDQAGSILTDQIKKRLRGIEKARVGARLAAIRMLDRKPELALRALTDSNVDVELPEALVMERRRLEARARFDTGDTLGGLALLNGDETIEALWLRSDMYWRLREWPMAANSLDDLIRAELASLVSRNSASEAPDDTMDPMAALASQDEAGELAPDADDKWRQEFKARVAPLLLNRAVALSLAGDRRGLKALAREFGDDMADTVQAMGFQMLTAPDNGLVESVSAEMQSVDQIQSFVDDYRQRLEKASLDDS